MIKKSIVTDPTKMSLKNDVTTLVTAGLPKFVKPLIHISEEGVTSVSASQVLKTEVATKQLDAINRLVKNGLLAHKPSKSAASAE